MDEETRKKLLEAARTIRDFCGERDCPGCPFYTSNHSCALIPEDDIAPFPQWWRIPNE